jgi:pimeloyl-ACP methyl ester carboxylesterase
MSPTPEVDPHRFPMRRAAVGGVEMAYVHEGRGGVPLLLVHGWPETKRIWWRNIAPLVRAGFEVVVPDLRGFGDTGPAPDGFYDVAASSEDLYALVHDVLDRPSCVTCGGDFGGVVLQDLALRRPGFVTRQVLFDTIPPFLGDAYEAAGVGPVDPTTLEHFVRHGTRADELLQTLDSPERRRAYVAGFYGASDEDQPLSSSWAGPTGFTTEAIAFMAEPFQDEHVFRASIALYEHAFGRPASALPLLFEPNPTTTLMLHGHADPVVGPAVIDCAPVAFPDIVGPFAVLATGHFLQWEAADLLDRTLTWYCRDLLGTGPGA